MRSRRSQVRVLLGGPIQGGPFRTHGLRFIQLAKPLARYGANEARSASGLLQVPARANVITPRGRRLVGLRSRRDLSHAAALLGSTFRSWLAAANVRPARCGGRIVPAMIAAVLSIRPTMAAELEDSDFDDGGAPVSTTPTTPRSYSGLMLVSLMILA